MKSNKIMFPESFEKKPHFSGTQWILTDGKNILISVVGGAKGLYGDGIKTFEMWDFKEEYPQGYLTIEEINKHIDEHYNKPNDIGQPLTEIKIPKDFK